MFLVDVSSSIEPLSAGLFVSPGFGTHTTRRLDSYELLFVTSGVLDLFEGAQIYRVRRNQALILNPGMHHGGVRPYPPDLNFYWVHFRKRDGMDVPDTLSIPKMITVPDPEFFTELFCQFIADQEANIPLEFGSAQIIALMLCEMGRSTSVVDHLAGVAPHVVAGQRALAESVEQCIEEKYRHGISTFGIAEILELSGDYLERVFKRIRHRSIGETINEKRVHEAKLLLRREGRKNISEIAFACGFSDLRYFRRIFKRLTGLTPKEFRLLHGKTHINTH